MGFVGRLLMDSLGKEISEQVRNNIYYQNTFSWLNNGQPIALPDNPTTYVTDGYLKMAAVNRCVNLILNKISSIPVYVYEVEKGKSQKYREFQNLIKSTEIAQKAKAYVIKSKTMQEVNVPEINSLIENPNKFQTWDNWIKYFVGSYLLTGNAYDYYNGLFIQNPEKFKPTEHFVLPTARIEIVSGGVFNPVRGYKMDASTQAEKEYNAWQVMHWKSFNPEYSTTGSQLYGISVLRAYLEPILRNKLGDKELSRQIANGGSFGFIAPKNKEDNLQSDQKKDLKKAMIDAKKSNDEISRIFPSSIPLDWTQVGLPIEDLGLLKVKQVDEESIYKAFNVPLVYANQDSASYNNQSTADKQFIYNSIAPLTEDVGTLLTKMICEPIEKRTGKKYVIHLDFNSLPEMQADMGKIADWLAKSPDLTMNEKREIKGFGRLEVPGMDSIWISGNQRLIQDAAIPMSDFE